MTSLRSMLARALAQAFSPPPKTGRSAPPLNNPPQSEPVVNYDQSQDLSEKISGIQDLYDEAYAHFQALCSAMDGFRSQELDAGAFLDELEIRLESLKPIVDEVRFRLDEAYVFSV